MAGSAGRLNAPDSSVLSAKRCAGVVLVGAWAGTFWFLLLAGRTPLYLSTRTQWVVPLGAVLFTVLFLGRCAALAGPRSESFTVPEAAGYLLLALPVIVVLVLPPAALTSFAAARRSSISSAGIVGDVSDSSTGNLTLVGIAGAMQTEEGRDSLGTRAGEEVSFIGFVAHDDAAPADEFTLTRFVVSCCVADALTVQVRVVGVPPGEFADDDWVRVTGNFYPLARDVIVDATDVVKVPRPRDPYLNP